MLAVRLALDSVLGFGIARQVPAAGQIDRSICANLRLAAEN